MNLNERTVKKYIKRNLKIMNDYFKNGLVINSNNIYISF